MALVWEYQVEGEGNGWKGWRVTVTASNGSRVFAFDERDDVFSPAEAIRRTMADSVFDEMTTGCLVFEVDPIRTLVSAEINPN